MPRFHDADRVARLLEALAASVEAECDVYLLGETGLVREGLARWARRLEVHIRPADADRPRVDDAVAEIRRRDGLEVVEVDPADRVPLPAGHAGRARAAAGVAPSPLRVLHYDPVSQVIAALARGDEEDYRLGLALLRHGWVTADQLERSVEEVLPRFRQREGHQDRAEFRRRYRGLRQMWRAAGGNGSPGRRGDPRR